MKWIGQHIYDYVATFRQDVTMDGDLSIGGTFRFDSVTLSRIQTSSESFVDNDTSVMTSAAIDDRINTAISAEDLDLTADSGTAHVDLNSQDLAINGGTGITTEATGQLVRIDADATQAQITSLGSAGATTNILAGDLTMYNAVNDGNPTIGLGSSVNNRLEIKSTYNSGTQTLCDVNFSTYSQSTTTNDGRMIFEVDDVEILRLLDNGILSAGNVSCTDGHVSVVNKTTSSATEGGLLKLQSDDGAAMGDNHRLGVIEFQGAEDTSATRSIGARIQAIARDAWDGSNNDADLEFYTTDGTTESKVLTLDADKEATFTGKINSVDTTTSSATQGGEINLRSDDGAALGDDHRLGKIGFQAAEDGSSTIFQGASIQAFADAAWSGSENGTRLELYTADGDGSKELSLTLDSDLLATFAGSVTVTSDLTVNGDTVTFESANADDPQFIIKNTTADAQGARLQMRKDRGASMVQGDRVGEIDFIGEDASQNQQQYSKIITKADVVTHGQESGKFQIQVASHDGQLEDGLILAGGSVDAEVDVEIGKGAASVTTVAGDLVVTNDLTVNGDTVTFESANADDPAVIIKNTTNDNQAARLQFKKDRGAAAVDSDRVAEIDFIGEDASQNSQQYGKIMVRAKETAHGNEAGQMNFQVAQYDGSIGLNGLLIEGSKTTDDVIDVTVGYGAASTTTIAGNLTVTGTGNTHLVGQYAVLRCSAFYVNDNPMVQNSLYFGHSTGNQPMNWNDPAAVGGVIGDTSSFTIDGDDENWGILLPFNISKVDVQCSIRPQLGTGDDFTVAIYTGTRSTDSSADLTLTKVAHNSVNISGTGNRYTQNDVSVTADYNAGTMIYVGVGSEDSTDMKNGRGYMNITVTRR